MLFFIKIIIYLPLYNKLSYARILIGSHLCSIGGQTRDVYYIKQIDSSLPCVCSVIDQRGRQNVVRTKKVAHEAQPSVSLMSRHHKNFF